jgi:MFS family permease
MDTPEEPTPMPESPPHQPWPRNVVALGLTSLFTDVSSEMLVPVLPLFVTATLHASVASLGIIEGIAECTASVLRLGAGWWSDRSGQRKPFLIFGYGLSGVAKAVMGLAVTWPAVLGLRFTDRIGKALRNPPRDALIAESTSEAGRGRAFGLHRALDTTGAAIGPLLAWWLLGRWSSLGAAGYRRLFLVSAIPAAIAVAILIVVVRAPRRAPVTARALRARAGSFGAPFRRFLTVDAIFQLGNSSMAFLLLRTQAAGWSAGQVALVYFGYNLLYAALAMPFGGWGDRIGRRPLLVGAYLVYACSYAVAAGWATRAGVVLAFALLAVHSALIEGQARSLVADLVPGEARATAYGVQATVVGLALLPASIIAGELWDHASPAAPFWFGAALAALAALAMLIFLPPHREVEDRDAVSIRTPR